MNPLALLDAEISRDNASFYTRMAWEAFAEGDMEMAAYFLDAAEMYAGEGR